MANKKLISIILPLYNGQAFLEEVIDSVFSQSYSNFELIIVNDCSTDNSLIIAEKFAKKDNRIIVISNEENKKLPASLNIGHKIASGNYITWTSDDNILKPNFLESLIRAININQADIVYSNYDIVNEQGDFNRLHKTGPTEHLFFGNKIGASFLYKKEVFEVLNGFDESLFLLEDYDFWLRANAKFKFYHLNENLYQYRLHSNSLTSDIQNKKEANFKHEKGILKMIKKISYEFHWNDDTFNLLTENLLGKDINILNALKKRELIIMDLLKVSPKNFDDASVIIGFKMLLRNQLTTNNCNFKTLIWVLKREKWLLFHPSFSKKTTLIYMLNSLFR